jgi:uncharacterized membrane protein YdjX (TVP38/TMEM64 family)
VKRRIRPNNLRLFWNYPNAIALIVLFLCLLLCVWLSLHPDLTWFTPERLLQTIRRLGVLAPVAYIGMLALSVVISPIPGAPIAVVAGTIWGSLLAGVYSVIGGFLGSAIAYYIGRTLGRSAIQFLTGKNIYFTKQHGEIYLTWFIFLTRLLPVLPFDLISYAAGIAGLSFPAYACATLLGMIPSTFFLTYLGSTFMVNKFLSIILLLVFLILLVGLPWGIRRHNWLGIQNIIRIE